jgi:hypothetical protein
VSITRDSPADAVPVASLGLSLLATLHGLYRDTFDFAATRDSVGSPTVWQAIRDGATPQAAQALDAASLARFARLRQQNLRY